MPTRVLIMYSTSGHFHQTSVIPRRAHELHYVQCSGIKPTSSQSMMLFMSIHLIYLRRIFVNPRCGLSGDLFANHVRLTVIKVCSPRQAFLLPSPSQREHCLYLWLSENIFPALLSLTTTFRIVNVAMQFCLFTVVAPFYRPTFAENDILITIDKCQSSIILLEYPLNCHGKVAMKCQLKC